MKHQKILLVILFSNNTYSSTLLSGPDFSADAQSADYNELSSLCAFSQKYLFFNAFSGCVSNTPMLAWNRRPADRLPERSLTWLLQVVRCQTHNTSFYFIFLWLYELHAVAITH